MGEEVHYSDKDSYDENLDVVVLCGFDPFRNASRVLKISSAVIFVHASETGGEHGDLLRVDNLVRENFNAAMTSAIVCFVEVAALVVN